MKLFLITTNGMCTRGKAIVLAESEEHARQTFEISLGDESNEAENEIINIQEIVTDTVQVVYYDDGDR